MTNEELFEKWLKSKTDAKQKTVHLKQHRKFHLDFIDYVREQLSLVKVSGSVAFAKWIGERMNIDGWLTYDERLGTWYWHMKGHLTTEELYEVWLATDR